MLSAGVEAGEKILVELEGWLEVCAKAAIKGEKSTTTIDAARRTFELFKLLTFINNHSRSDMTASRIPYSRIPQI